jgi:glycosyltransferase involved in cell wall biosynthesis
MNQSMQAPFDGIQQGSSQRLRGLTIAHVFALGNSARHFLIPQFRALAAAGVKQWLVASPGEPANEAAALGQCELKTVTINQFISPVSDLIAVWKLKNFFQETKPEIVCAHMSKAGVVGMIGARLAGVRTRVYHNHGMAMFSARGIKRAMLWAVEWISGQFATDVLFCSESTKREAIRLGVTPAHKARVLGGGTIAGIDTEKFRPAASEQRSATRAQWGVSGDTVVVGFVGRPVPHKGVRTLLEAWALLDGTDGGKPVKSNARLVLAGGHGDPEIERLIAESSRVDPSITFLGYQSDMPKVYAGFDVIVLPSWHEGFPYSLLEAQSTGIPAIASRVTGNEDAVNDGQTGLLVPVRDPVALAGALKKLILDGDLRQRFGLSARDRIVSAYTQSEVVNNHLQFFADNRENQTP